MTKIDRIVLAGVTAYWTAGYLFITNLERIAMWIGSHPAWRAALRP